MAENEILIGSVGGMSLAIIVESIDLAVWLGNAVDRIAVAILALGVLVDVVTQVDNVWN